MNAVLAASSAVPLADTWGFHDTGTGWWFVMMFAMVLFWGLIIYASTRLLRGRPSAPGAHMETPAEILNRRLADGTLSPEEFKEHRRLMSEAGNGDD